MATDTHPNLTHDEVWDDSDLQDSWNDAFEEYKKYHSLAAKGEKVDITTKPSQPIKSKAEALLTNGTATPALQPDSSSTPANFIGPALPPPLTADTSTPGAFGKAAQPTPGAFGKQAQATGAGMPTLPGLASLPQTLLGSVQDEAMKNIMMSWYYAGYYTGLYDGQQKAWADMQDIQETGRELGS